MMKREGVNGSKRSGEEKGDQGPRYMRGSPQALWEKRSPVVTDQLLVCAGRNELTHIRSIDRAEDCLIEAAGERASPDLERIDQIDLAQPYSLSEGIQVHT